MISRTNRPVPWLLATLFPHHNSTVRKMSYHVRQTRLIPLAMAVVFVALVQLLESNKRATDVLNYIGILGNMNDQELRRRSPPSSNLPKRPRYPSIPLRPECLAIVQSLPPVNLSYVDVAGNHTEHPHMGALDEDGNPGFIHDPTTLRKSERTWRVTEEYQREQCNIHDDDYKLLTERVFVDMEYDRKRRESGVPRPKIFCALYTSAQSHDKVQNIRDTWGPHCDGFMAASNVVHPDVDSVHLLHEGPEDYMNLWQKVRSMWSYMYDNYYDSYDWFHIGGDDMFVIVENMRYYLESEEIQTAQNGGIQLPDGTETVQWPLYLGKRYKWYGIAHELYNTGGPGYTLNRAALKKLVVESFPYYEVHAKRALEDNVIGEAFRELKVTPYDTKDENGSERYMHYPPGFFYDFNLSKAPYPEFYLDPQMGINHTTPRSISFHYVKGDLMKRLYSLVYYPCTQENSLTNVTKR